MFTYLRRSQVKKTLKDIDLQIQEIDKELESIAKELAHLTVEESEVSKLLAADHYERPKKDVAYVR